MANKNNSNLSFGLILLVIAVLFFVAGFLVSRLLNRSGDPTYDDMDIAQNETIRITQTETIRVEHAVIIPSDVPQQVAQQPVAQQPVVQQPASSSRSYRTTSRNLDLQVSLDGNKYYFSADEWSALNHSEQNRFTKLGLVINHEGQSFVMKLIAERNLNGSNGANPYNFTWAQAVQHSRTVAGGWRLPSKNQGLAIVKQRTKVLEAIQSFGGSIDSSYFWTSTERDEDTVWTIAVSTSISIDKNMVAGVRLIRAL